MSEVERGHRRAPTIDDVAARCGVATSTVSRAFSRPERVSAATRELVLATAAAMGYRPNPIARALPSGRTRTLGLLVPDITNPFFLNVIRGAERRAAETGYTLVLADTEESPDKESVVLDRLRGAVDGYVLASSRSTDEALCEAYARAPLVVVNRRPPGVPRVVIDSARGIARVVEHLDGLGHRRLAYLAGPRRSWSNSARWAAIRRAARRRGLEVDRVPSALPTLEGGEAAADAVRRTGATAVVTFNDLLAIGLLRGLTAAGVAVPEQIGLVGCDDIFGADICSPPLTTLSAPLEQAGRSAVDLLVRVLGEQPTDQEVRLTTQLRVRASTGPAPAARTGARPAHGTREGIA